MPRILQALLKGNSGHSWQPVMTAKTTTVDYWFNWRVLTCAIWVLSSMIIAAILIWKYEGSNTDPERPTRQETVGTLYEDESWRPCLKNVHPAWLLFFRALAFFVLLALLIVNVVVEGGSILYFYTQWTFALVTTYFALGSLLSIYGCHKVRYQDNPRRLDAERGSYLAPANGESASVSSTIKNSRYQEGHYVRPVAGIWGYVFQIIYQTNAGAVVLTDCVFWLIIFPFLEMRNYDLNFFMIVMHSVNAIFLLGDTLLNSLRFPWFRISYFLLWTAIYVLFQWIIHACISMWWPYTFLDLSSSYAPMWYLVVALMHVPCYAIYRLIITMKQLLFSKWFPHYYIV